MSNMLQTGATWLRQRMRSHAAVSIVYEHTGDAEVAAVELLATPGTTAFDQVDEYGVLHRYEARDFLVSPADLQHGGKRFLPRAGDRIREPRDGAVATYEVMAVGDGPPWRYSDAGRAAIRIHTKLVSTE